MILFISIFWSKTWVIKTIQPVFKCYRLRLFFCLLRRNVGQRSNQSLNLFFDCTLSYYWRKKIIDLNAWMYFCTLNICTHMHTYNYFLSFVVILSSWLRINRGFWLLIFLTYCTPILTHTQTHSLQISLFHIPLRKRGLKFASRQ